MYGSSSAGVEGQEISKHAHTTVLCNEVMRSCKEVLLQVWSHRALHRRGLPLVLSRK